MRKRESKIIEVASKINDHENLPFTVVGEIESEYLRLKGKERYDHISKYRILEIEEQDA